MAALTNFLKLLKPERNDYVDVDKHINENYDKIDSKMQELNTSNSGKLDKGAVSTEYDTAKKIEDKIKAAQGTADNKLNKGSLPATVPDGKAIYDLLENNGGINIDPNLLYLNDAGTKTQGKVYFDRNKKGLFECVQTTTATTNSTTYFVDISNKASADRLANLNIKSINWVTVSFMLEGSSVIRRQLSKYDAYHKMYFIAMIPSDADRPINIQLEPNYILRITDLTNNPNYIFIMGIIEFIKPFDNNIVF